MTRRIAAARGVALAAAAAPLALLLGCPREAPRKPASGAVASTVPRESNAGADLLARASSPAEREALLRARAEEDEKGRRAAAERDAEIERLRRENAELEARLGGR